MSFSLTKAVEAIAEPILSPVFGIIDQVVTDKDLAVQLKADIQLAILRIQEKTLEVQGDVVMAEAKGESAIQRMWRPIFMVFLMGNIQLSVVAGMLGYAQYVADGWAAIPEPAWLLAQIGLGGYVGGRTIEKVTKIATGSGILDNIKSVLPRWKRDKDYEK
jgi:hypothetical protein